MDKIREYAIKCFQNEAQALLDLIPLLTNDFDNAVEQIYHCKGKLVITGVGKSGHIGAKIAATLASTGTPSFFLNPLDAYHGDLGMITNNDIVLAISYSGQTNELLRIIPYLIEKDIFLISMSSNSSSLLAQYSNCHLNIAVKREACPLNLAPTSSTTAALAMGDAIVCALMQIRNFQAMDFAQFHPGGYLGKRLLTTVKDVMYKNNLPIVFPNTKICDAIIEISKGKLGIVIIMENNEIKGIITDGDVRRAMQNKQKIFFKLTVSQIMTKNPKMIYESAKLSEAEFLIKQYNIHSIIVIDTNKNLVGVIDSFNCM
ncbi:Arabinose 5-phosphate isomerase KdsD [termite gut metagenome]|uniref:Arabinose 5-phosphate isomerase KdsD n=1 Tax=termite gut metagenome TaxID=433724 RepID=A0A5J4S9L1_9ZZZZ